MVIPFFRYVCGALCCAGVLLFSQFPLLGRFAVCWLIQNVKLQDSCGMRNGVSYFEHCAIFFQEFFCNQFWRTCRFGNLARTNVSISRDAFHLFANRASCELLCILTANWCNGMASQSRCR